MNEKILPEMLYPEIHHDNAPHALLRAVINAPVQRKDIDPHSNPRAFYATESKPLREEAGPTQAELADKVFCSGPYVGQTEQMIRAPRVELSELVDDALGSKGLLRRLAKLARQSRVADYFADVAALEPTAKSTSEYSPMVVPGLLRTKGYARSITLASRPLIPEGEADQYVSTRMARQEIFNGGTPPHYRVILHGAAPRTPLGGSSCMHEQLTHIVSMVQKRRVGVRVLSFAASEDAVVQETFRLMTFADGPLMACTEGSHPGQLIDDGDSAVEGDHRVLAPYGLPP